MRPVIFDSRASADHILPPGHPEHAGRYDAVRAALQTGDLYDWRTPTAAPRAALARFHGDAYIDYVTTAGQSVPAGELRIERIPDKIKKLYSIRARQVIALVVFINEGL